MNRKILCLFVVLFFFASLTAAAASHKEYYDAGKKAYKNKQYSEAYKNFKAAVSEKPDKAKYQYNLGLAARKLKYYDEAYQAFIKAKELDPGTGFTKKRNEFLKKIEEMRSKAGATASKPAKIFLSHKEYFESGKKAYKNKQYKQAFEYFKSAIAQKQDIAKYYYNLGLAARKLKNPEATYRALLKAQKLDPDLEFTNKRDDFLQKLEVAKYQVDINLREKEPIPSTTREVEKKKKKGGFPFLPIGIGAGILALIIRGIMRKKRIGAAAPPVQGGEGMMPNDRSRVISSTQREHGSDIPFWKRQKNHRDHTYDDDRYYDDHSQNHDYTPETGDYVSRRDES